MQGGLGRGARTHTPAEGGHRTAQQCAARIKAAREAREESMDFEGAQGLLACSPARRPSAPPCFSVRHTYRLSPNVHQGEASMRTPLGSLGCKHLLHRRCTQAWACLARPVGSSGTSLPCPACCSWMRRCVRARTRARVLDGGTRAASLPPQRALHAHEWKAAAAQGRAGQSASQCPFRQGGQPLHAILVRSALAPPPLGMPTRAHWSPQTRTHAAAGAGGGVGGLPKPRADRGAGAGH